MTLELIANLMGWTFLLILAGIVCGVIVDLVEGWRDGGWFLLVGLAIAFSPLAVIIYCVALA